MMQRTSVLLGITIVIAGFAAWRTADASRSTYVCNARSITGKRFSATGNDRVVTQEEAMKKCEKSSFRCYPAGCSTSLR